MYNYKSNGKLIAGLGSQDHVRVPHFLYFIFFLQPCAQQVHNRAQYPPLRMIPSNVWWSWKKWHQHQQNDFISFSHNIMKMLTITNQRHNNEETRNNPIGKQAQCFFSYCKKETKKGKRNHWITMQKGERNLTNWQCRMQCK